jgi:DNA-binding NtrC family response regulator
MIMGAKNILQAGDSGGAGISRELESLLRILVVDGEPDIRLLTTEVLIQSGYEVVAAADAAAAWDELNDDIYYDLVITENTMPQQTGIELLKKLRAARMILPVIMTTGTLPLQKFAASPWLQPHATLVKPFAVEELLGTVKNVLSQSDSSRKQIAPPPDVRRLPSAGDLRL